MRLITSLSLAGLSALLIAAAADGQRRPQYGGTLRIALRSQTVSPESPAPWFGSVFETLVQLDETGRPQPNLAVSWSRDAAARRWVFVPRTGVRMHDGQPWVPSPASLSFPDDRPLDELLLELARPQNAIAITRPEALPVGTGPFRMSGWEKGKTLTLSAHDAHWAGRPFLDAVTIELNRPLRDQAIDFELNRTDVIESPVAELRRQRGPGVAVSPPVTLMALVAAQPVRGVGTAIDRASIHNVLLQKQGEPTGALLPQSLSGLAFLHPSGRDLDAARREAAGTPPLTFYYDRQDPLLRSVGDRIVLNASEAGIVLRPSADAGAQVRLEVFRIGSPSPRIALEDLAIALDLPAPSSGNLYAAERALLDTNRVIPLFHLPAAYRFGPRVRGWRAVEPWPLADIWLDQAGAP